MRALRLVGWSTLLCLAAACQWKWDDLGGEVPLVGAPLPPAQMTKLNSAPASRSSFVYDRQDRPYVTFTQSVTTEQGEVLGLRVIRLTGSPLDYAVLASEVFVSTYAFFVLTQEEEAGNPETLTTRLTTLEVGELGGGRNFVVPNGPGLLFPSDQDRVAFYLVQDVETVEYDLIRLDGSFRRKIPLPAGTEPIDPLSTMTFFFTGEEGSELLLVRDVDNRVTLYSTTSLDATELGVMEGVLWTVPERQLAFACGAGGLVAKSFDGTLSDVYDARPCATGFTQLGLTDQFIYYGVDDRLQRIELDGTRTVTQLAGDPRRLLHITIDGEGVEHLIMSSDPSSRYSNGAGSGYTGDWKFMERGRSARFASDLSRVYWIEHAALPSGAGELLMATVPGGKPLRLGQNVRKYSELEDGRLLANANVAFRGVHNRVVVIDPDRREQRWIAEAATDYQLIPGTHDLILDIIAGPDAIDVYRATIP